MATSLHAQIFQNLIDALAAIGAEAGYHFTVGKALGYLPAPSELAPLPVAAVTPGEVRGRWLPCSTVEKTAAFTATGWIDLPYGCDPIERAGQWQADLERALTADPTLNDLAIDTQVLAARAQIERERGLARLTLQVRVIFHEPQ